MNGNETETLLKRFSEALNARDRAAAQACLCSDAIIETPGPNGAGIRVSFDDMLTVVMHHFEGRIADLVIMSEASGVHAAAKFTLRGRYVASWQDLPPASSQPISLAAGAFFEVDGGRVSRITLHFRRAELERQVRAS